MKFKAKIPTSSDSKVKIHILHEEFCYDFIKPKNSKRWHNNTNIVMYKEFKCIFFFKYISAVDFCLF